MTDRAKPTPAQLRWQNCEMGAFFHFGINTFHDQEWGEGKDSPQTFNPTMLNCEQWILAVKRAGLKYAVLTAKHHDGFCLWPTKTTDYSVASSPFGGDVVGLFAEACAKHNLPCGVYLSPWDRHEPSYPDAKAYDEFYIAQLTELMTNYGGMFEVWFDGAGSQGRKYDWARIMDTVAKYQPDAMIFNMGRPTIRWVGNEDGLAPETCWNEAEAARASMYTNDMETWIAGTPRWVPAECDVPIRSRHWFWHPDDEKSLLTLEELLDIYYRSVGHGANLLLNISPDDRGLLPEADIELAARWRDELCRRFSRPSGRTYGRGYEHMIELDGNVISHAVIQEDIMHGELVRAFVVEVRQGDTWKEVAKGTSVGHKRIVRFDPVAADAMRLRITQAVDVPEILVFEAYRDIR